MTRAVLIVFFGVLLAGVARAETPLEAAAAARVRASVPAGLALVELSIPGAPAEAAALDVVWQGAPRAGVSSILLHADGRKLWARVRLAPMRPQLVARRALSAGAVVGAADLALEQRPEDRRALAYLSPSALTGATVQRDVAAGAAVPADALALPPPVARGTAVAVVVRRGAASISTHGTLERPARPGEPAAARLPTMRVVSGVLLDEKTLVVGAIQ